MVEKGEQAEPRHTHELALQPAPPLRLRGSDVVDLAQHVLLEVSREEGREFRRLAPDVQAAFDSYPWPGNVRELQNVIRNAVVLNDGDTLSLSMLSDAFRRAAHRSGALDGLPATVVPVTVPPRNGGAHGLDARHGVPAARPAVAADGGGESEPETVRPLREVVNEAIDAAIAACNGNIPRAAALLEVSPSTIYRRLKSQNGKAGRVSAP